MAQKVSTRRVMVSLSPDIHGVVERYAKAIGQPTARVIADLLKEIAPQLESTASICEDAKQGRVDLAVENLRKLSSALVTKSIEAQNQIVLPFVKKE